MALFKNLLIKYNIYKYEGDYLILHCSREDFVKAPFNGEITKKGNNLILRTKEFKLYLSHMTALKEGKVKAGDIIGQPMVDGMFGQSAAYILVKIYKDGKLDDIVKYLKFKDKTEENKEVVVEIKETIIDEVTKTEYEAVTEAEVEIKPKKTTTKKKSSSKKKKK